MTRISDSYLMGIALAWGRKLNTDELGEFVGILKSIPDAARGFAAGRSGRGFYREENGDVHIVKCSDKSHLIEWTSEELNQLKEKGLI